MNATEYAERTEQRFNEMTALAKEFSAIANQAIDERNALREQVKALREALTLIGGSESFKGGTSLQELRGIARAALAQTKESA